MTRVRGSIGRADFRPAFDAYRRFGEQVLERAALRATDGAARQLKSEVRSAMAGAGLGRLGNAIDATSDEKRGRGVYRRPGGGFSASGLLYARSRSERTLGALQAYTKGASIVPVRGRWLWIATDEAGRLIGSGKTRRRLTPGEYVKAGSPLGPLITIRGPNGRPLLAVERVGKSAVGARGGRVRTLTKRGQPRKGDRVKEIAVLFFAIPATARAARVDIEAIASEVQGRLPDLFNTELRREGNRSGR